jgi:hypothetical protein
MCSSFSSIGDLYYAKLLCAPGYVCQIVFAISVSKNMLLVNINYQDPCEKAVTEKSISKFLGNKLLSSFCH